MSFQRAASQAFLKFIKLTGIYRLYLFLKWRSVSKNVLPIVIERSEPVTEDSRRIYCEILADKDGPLAYTSRAKDSIAMVKHYHPWSITVNEFDYLRRFIIKHDLRTGYECATAFGVSGLAIALGMKATGGELVTMDAYIEEHCDFDLGYRNKQSVYSESDGYRSAAYLMKKFGVDEHVHLTVGWSPTNVKENLEKHFDLTNRKLDFVFIDAGHWDSAAIADATAVCEHLADKFAVFFHDTQCFSKKFFEFVKNTFGVSEYRIVVPEPHGWNLGLVTNLEDAALSIPMTAGAR